MSVFRRLLHNRRPEPLRDARSDRQRGRRAAVEARGGGTGVSQGGLRTQDKLARLTSDLTFHAMGAVRLSTKGQIVIPKRIREMLGWRPGQRLEVTPTPGGVMLRADEPRQERSLDEVAGCLQRFVPSDAAIEHELHDAAVAKHVRRQWLDRGDGDARG